MKRSLFFQTLFLIFIGLSLMNSGCSTLQGILGEDEKPPAAKNDLVRFSETPQVLNTADRKYRRMTRTKMEEESDLGSQAGSMWVMEGQGAYLFSQNRTRREGDLLNVKVEGGAQKQIETKVAVIKMLLKQLEEEEKKSQQPVETTPIADNNPNPKKAEGSDRAPASTAAAAADKKEADEPLDVGAVPTRIIERMADGNYRVKGAQPFMIGKREYKVIVTGIIRPEDYNDEGVSSNKLLDPQYDVVSLRRSVQ
ncbi:MAG: flagellar biosynthesis protein FlgH [Bdellovibrio sp. CG10_big_fil_rev_8_21_14_0_10_47_8]|nr:MAG: flagellar biosynthesis protein FlgH [Bdellovibrio sp. CG10_big_fil_rev_8_21_14_0_10_47_8]